MITSTSSAVIPAAESKSSPVKPDISPTIVAAFGKFSLYVVTASCQISMPSRTLNPACSKPLENII